MNKFDLLDNIEKSIIYLTDNNKVEKTKLQKSIFLYLIDFCRINKMNFKEVPEILNFQPYKFGPYSDIITGLVDEMAGYNKIIIQNDESIKSENMIDKYNYTNEEKSILNDIKELTKNLSKNEFVFYVYFNPTIPENIKKYFISKSEIKSRLKKDREYYIKRLIKKGVITEYDALLYED